MGTYARQKFLFPTYEINIDKLFGRDEEGLLRSVGVLDEKSIKEFDRLQEESAVGHWAIMRTVVPSDGWENY